MDLLYSEGKGGWEVANLSRTATTKTLLLNFTAFSVIPEIVIISIRVCFHEKMGKDTQRAQSPILTTETNNEY